MENFPVEERIKKRTEIRKILRKGKSAYAYGAKLSVLEAEQKDSSQSFSRIAFTFGPKYGNAVQRNRAKRLGREAYRHVRKSIKPGYDLVLMVFQPKDKKYDARYQDRLRQLKNLFYKANLFKGRRTQ
ncbi:MAG: ribonuclease P protein component [Spirochaetaceae bacterium]|jgi:ribonuclease P protein component|nr:ribonuclease P protein component [Spirochaetaceae bacterium]